METEDLVKQNYELAFHINPTVEDSKVAEIKSALEEIVVSGGGVIAFSKVPERQKLSYAIEHERTSWFGYIHFSLTEKETLVKLEDHIRLDNNIMRHILLRLETDAQKQKALVKAAEHKERMERRAKRVQQQTTEKQDSKDIEKQLEDVIGNI